MAMGAENARRPFSAAGVDDVSARAVAPAFLAAEKERRPVDPMIWGDEKRMKRSSWHGPRPWRPWRSARTPPCHRRLVAVHETQPRRRG
ncbi:hypothetical protein PR202_ga17699 [Eleusine coracana subsp. coracana]|uniref:Uncharacterized protein n=1 Tax=Eleusine coracana subsp. coracana TaxID=191504 RepID=A0AAV5CR73_ELECO|nr:hypothetical protein PR202_ga17452 [Eleusine coracana subsp. coracana]GJN00510.1 hypothetical protein PR202_ga17699 [Eleusine coracana subsp. coracana]